MREFTSRHLRVELKHQISPSGGIAAAEGEGSLMHACSGMHGRNKCAVVYTRHTEHPGWQDFALRGGRGDA